LSKNYYGKIGSIALHFFYSFEVSIVLVQKTDSGIKTNKSSLLVVYISARYMVRCFHFPDTSHGSVASLLRWGGKFSDSFVTVFYRVN